jgi:hypothetical protein
MTIWWAGQWDPFPKKELVLQFFLANWLAGSQCCIQGTAPLQPVSHNVLQGVASLLIRSLHRYVVAFSLSQTPFSQPVFLHRHRRGKPQRLCTVKATMMQLEFEVTHRVEPGRDGWPSGTSLRSLDAALKRLWWAFVAGELGQRDPGLETKVFDFQSPKCIFWHVATLCLFCCKHTDVR